MKIQAVKVEDAVGCILSHDLTQVVRGEFKGAPFKKGHIITEEDIPELLKMGKENIYILELDPGDVHEDSFIRCRGRCRRQCDRTEPRSR